MKRKLLLFVFIFISSSAIIQAQISKGSIFLGGSFGVNIFKAKTDLPDADQKITNISFSPALGKVIKDNLVVGIELNVGGYDSEISNVIYEKHFNAGAGVFVRKYYEVLKKFYIYGHGRFGVNYLKEERQNGIMNGIESKGYGVAASIYPGLSYAINKKIHIETSLNNLISASFTHKKNEYENPTAYTSKTNEFNIGSSLFSQSGYSVGIRFLL